jgi:hypothetical protein
MATRDQFDPRRSWPGFLILAGLVLTLTFTLLQPSASDGLTGPALLGFWAAHVLIPLSLLQTVQLALAYVWQVARLPPLMQVSITGLVGAALFAPVALALDWIFGLADVTDDAAETLGTALLDEFAALAPVLILVWIGLNAPRLIRLDPIERSSRAQMPPPQDFWQRTPLAIGRDLVAMSAELHYLRIRTALGETLVLYPFGRAVAELAADAAGLQIHRSHWVAKAHVTRVNRRGQGAICTLSTGLALPVSRQYRAALEAIAPPSA